MHRYVLVAIMIGCTAPAPPAPPAKQASTATPASEPARSDPAWLAEIVTKRIVYSVSGMEQLSANKDVVYKHAGAVSLTMDVWAPKQPGPRPAIVFVHGGPIPGNLKTQPKDWGIFVSYGQLAAASGLVGVTFNHRLYGFDRVADARADLVDLLAELRTNATKYGIDRDRICLWRSPAAGRC